MDINNYLAKAAAYYNENYPHIRFGQALYNCLPQDIASKINNTDIDPFHHDLGSDKVKKFLDFMEENYG